MDKKITICVGENCKVSKTCAKFERFDNIKVSEVQDGLENYVYVQPQTATDCMEYESVS